MHYYENYRESIHQFVIILTLTIICIGITMIAKIVLLLVATFHVAPLLSKYLLVQLEDANELIIDPLPPGPRILKKPIIEHTESQGKL